MRDKLKQLLEPTPKAEIKFRVGQVYPKKSDTGEEIGASAKMLCYVDARYVFDRLDDVIGPENWCTEFKEIKGNMFCGISNKIDDEWVTKRD